jgi:PBP1b-binding outer membrane lipoprotein LpoB
MKNYCLFIFNFFLLIHCKTNTAYLNPNQDAISSEWGPVEIKETTDTIAKELKEYLVSKNSKVLEIGKFKNNTSEHIDTDLLATELSSSLVQSQIRFVDRSKRRASINELKLSQEGVLNKDIKLELDSPDYFLECSVFDNVRYIQTNKIQYIVVSFQLVQLTTSSIVWQKEKKFLKETRSKLLEW